LRFRRNINAILNADELGTRGIVVLQLIITLVVIFKLSGVKNTVDQQRKFLVFILELIELCFCLRTDALEVRLYSSNFENEDETNKSRSSYFCIILLKSGVNKFFQKCLSRVQLMIIVFDLSHEERVEAVDSFKFEMIIIGLLNGRFKVESDDNIKVPELPEELKDTLMADFTNGYLNTSEIDNHLAE
jgi:hypothetical protein